MRWYRNIYNTAKISPLELGWLNSKWSAIHFNPHSPARTALWLLKICYTIFFRSHFIKMIWYVMLCLYCIKNRMPYLYLINLESLEFYLRSARLLVYGQRLISRKNLNKTVCIEKSAKFHLFRTFCTYERGHWCSLWPWFALAYAQTHTWFCFWRISANRSGRNRLKAIARKKIGIKKKIFLRNCCAIASFLFVCHSMVNHAISFDLKLNPKPKLIVAKCESQNESQENRSL